MAEAERFELSRALQPLPVFKTGPFSHLGKLPTNSYSNIFGHNWWTLQDSNLQPTGYEPGALTIELRVLILDLNRLELTMKVVYKRIINRLEVIFI